MTLHSETPSMMRPVAERERLVSMDALRGFALLGILMVNMNLFAMPFGEFIAPANFGQMPVAELLSWGFVKIFCEMKFISLFSLLFGAGLIMQWTRAQERGAPFVGLYLRRLGVLALIGLVHAIGLWYGDILFLYACLGFVLLWFRTFSPKVLTIIAVVILSLMTTLGLGVGTAGLVFEDFFAQFDQQAEPDQTQPAATSPATQPAEEAPALIDAPATQMDAATQPDDASIDDAPFAWFGIIMTSADGLSDPKLLEAETQAFKHGPLGKALEFRLVWYAIALSSALAGYGWHVLAMFFIGAALMKWNAFNPQRAKWRWRFLMLGILVGLPFEIGNATLVHLGITTDRWPLLILAAGIHEVGGASLCLGLFGGVCLIANSGRVKAVTAAIANVGRLALSNYLLQTIVATSLMYWWGLGWFGDVSRAEQIALALAIFAGQIVLSAAWLRVFKFGPVEWLWRTLTYMKIQPFLRSTSTSGGL